MIVQCNEFFVLVVTYHQYSNGSGGTKNTTKYKCNINQTLFDRLSSTGGVCGTDADGHRRKETPLARLLADQRRVEEASSLTHLVRRGC